MTDQTKTAGVKGKTKDYISQLKKETVGAKDVKPHNDDGIDWDGHLSEEEEETTQQKKRVVVQQGAVGSDRPKKLKDLFEDTPKQTKPRVQPAKTGEG